MLAKYCQGCLGFVEGDNSMIVEPYTAALGYKRTGRWWHMVCLYRDLGIIE